ncbi:hypothetical protein EDM56_00580 [Brevibacillus fluminis]|uniref:Fibronectin type III domain-containing protein n=1 Tax=Brevibacillus fluminis TaxID=511487 RepID=A0A3M8DYP9_9BACL|nr:hypothetical protein EDM56_00580 [Brevibacillus fluminis]
MSISWDNSAGYTDVHVYLNGVEKGPVGSNASSYEFSGLNAATTYTVRLELKDPTDDAPTLTITKKIPTQNEL